MGVNMYPSSSLLGDHKDNSIAALPVDELIEKADGFAGVFPGNHVLLKYFSAIRKWWENGRVVQVKRVKIATLEYGMYKYSIVRCFIALQSTSMRL